MKAKLHLYNSITRQLDEFKPASGNNVTWYICGPTVYDHSHLGHARTYMTFDILKRVMQDYFGYNILHVMNITDVEDKIILRARKNYLIDKYVADKHPAEIVLKDVAEALLELDDKIKTTTSADKVNMMKGMHASILNSLKKCSEANNSVASIDDLILSARDPLSTLLDSRHGMELSDYSIFDKLSRYFEDDFLQDMKLLNVQAPDAITRVSDYVPEVVEFIQKIINNGYAYESNGSVYFDTIAFSNDPNHEYAKMSQFSADDMLAELEDAEGELTAEKSDKRNQADFALWKASKTGEPYWECPWGKGRPGWHIECSVMASAIIPGVIDIHCGGIDLKFPHHDNELAQSEAYYGCNEWVKYFLHAGHLNIKGQKMSKSLKNFTTIKKCLENVSARILRFFFLAHKWGSPLDFADGPLEEAINTDKAFQEFFLNIKNILRQPKDKLKLGPTEMKLVQGLGNCQLKVHEALCNNVNTSEAISHLMYFMKEVNIYVQNISSTNIACKSVLIKIANYYTKMCKSFGLISDNKIGFSDGQDNGQLSTEDIVMPYLEALANFRSSVRDMALSRTPKDVDILNKCGEIRDVVMPNLGVRFEDKTDMPTVIKMMSKTEIVDVKKQAEINAEKQRVAALKRAELAKKDAEKLSKAKISPTEIFKSDPKYTGYQFDDEGYPTIDPKGEPVNKSQKKKLTKVMEAHKRKYQQLTK